MPSAELPVARRRLVHGDTKATRLRPEHRIEDDREHAEADHGPNLRHRPK